MTSLAIAHLRVLGEGTTGETRIAYAVRIILGVRVHAHLPAVGAIEPLAAAIRDPLQRLPPPPVPRPRRFQLAAEAGGLGGGRPAPVLAAGVVRLVVRRGNRAEYQILPAVLALCIGSDGGRIGGFVATRISLPLLVSRVICARTAWAAVPSRHALILPERTNHRPQFARVKHLAA